jgi:hypothetical protein
MLACLVLAPGLSLLSGCSVYMEATRPTPVDLSKLEPGESRDTVVAQLGIPKGTTPEADGTSCDSYELYTHGYGAGGKIPVAFLEGAADAFTLGLAEVVTTPIEGATKNQLHPVTICYSGGKLVRITDGGVIVLNGSAEASEPAQASAGGPTATVVQAAKPSTPNSAVSGGPAALSNPSAKGPQPGVPQPKSE